MDIDPGARVIKWPTMAETSPAHQDHRQLTLPTAARPPVETGPPIGEPAGPHFAKHSADQAGN
jgi:hypothetical protein